MIDLAHARELFPTGERAAVLELAPDQPVEYDAWDLESWTPGLARAAARAGAVEVIDRRPAGRPGPRPARVRAVARRRSPTRCGPAARGSTSASSSTGITTSTCCRWRSRSTCAADTAACDIQFGMCSVRPTRRTRGTPPSSRCVPTATSTSANPTSASPCSTTAATATACSTVGCGSAWRAPPAIPIPTPIRASTPSTWRVPARRRAGRRARRGRAPQPPARIVVGRVRTGSAPIVRSRADRAPRRRDRCDQACRRRPGDLIVRLHEAVGNRTRISVGARPRIGASRCNLLEEPQSGSRSATASAPSRCSRSSWSTLRLTPSPATVGPARIRSGVDGRGGGAPSGRTARRRSASPSRRRSPGWSGWPAPCAGCDRVACPPRNIIVPGTSLST